MPSTPLPTTSTPKPTNESWLHYLNLTRLMVAWNG